MFRYRFLSDNECFPERDGNRFLGRGHPNALVTATDNVTGVITAGTTNGEGFYNIQELLQSARVRHEAFVSHMKANGIAVDRTLLMTGNHRTDGGVQAMRQLLRLHKPPTAVVTSNDVTAIGALGAIYAAGLRVPDDIAFASLTQPPLTTASLSRVQLAVTALAALEQLIRRESTRKIEYRITTHLVVRQSTRAI